ncbi:DUF6776 family protein [Psychromonas sp. MME2]|uniref:DUF6776 family protein n=1 Tax=unclassified Psychromonas TaxID=2614957 RepID=UPI00339C399A
MQRLRKHAIKWITVSLICLLLGFLLGKFKQDILLDSLQLQEMELDQLKDEKMVLSKQAAAYQAQLMIDEKIIAHLTHENKKLHENMDVAANKLYFYERVIAPELEEKGIKVFSFTVTKNEDADHEWEYELVLMQAEKDRHLITGTFDLLFSVFDEGEITNMALSELNTFADSEQLSFKFKYFQTLKGSFELPKNITVDEVTLQVDVNKSRRYKRQTLEQNYEWNSLTHQDDGDLPEYGLEDLTRLAITGEMESI